MSCFGGLLFPGPMDIGGDWGRRRSRDRQVGASRRWGRHIGEFRSTTALWVPAREMHGGRREGLRRGRE
jgi:hypothetical protein